MPASAVDPSEVAEQIAEELVSDGDGALAEELSKVKEALQDAGDNLKPITPVEARDKYLGEREDDASYETFKTISQCTKLFVDWAEDAGIENLNTVGGRELQNFKDWCKDESDNNTVSLNGILGNVRRFLKYCVKIEAVAGDVPEKTPVPNVPDDEDVCYDKPSDGEVAQALTYLRQYEYASRRHIEYEIVAEIGCRMGAARALDEDEDIDLDEPAIQFRHRPEKAHPDERGTPLKNRSDGERSVNISNRLAQLIQDYLDHPDRSDDEDKFNRDPLLSTDNGRVTLSTFRRDFYKLTRPCVYSGTCPHDRDVETCEAAKNKHASKCPSSYTPHPLRRWSIERQIDQGVPKELLTDRVDVSVPILNEHYDNRNEERKRKHRLKLLEKIYSDYGDPASTLDDDTLEDLQDEMTSTLQPNPDELSGNAGDLPIGDETAIGSEAEKADIESDDDEGSDSIDDSQAKSDDLDDGINTVTSPVAWSVVVSVAVGRWFQSRVIRELNAMTPDTDSDPIPRKSRAAKGLAAYCVFVGLVTLNFALLGVPSMTLF